MTDALDAAFARCRADQRPALIGYLPAGHPDPATSMSAFEALVDNGVDVVEVGFAFSDPLMDGPTIQAAAQRVLDAGLTVEDHLAFVAKLHASRPDVPLVVMTYSTIAHRRGWKTFASELADAGVSGVILADLPVDAAPDWQAAAADAGLATIFIAASTSTDDRLAAIGQRGSGFVYAAGLLGVTGVDGVSDQVGDFVSRIKAHTELPVCVGIGVRNADDARRVAAVADGVIVGSALVRAADESIDALADLVTELRGAVAG